MKPHHVTVAGSIKECGRRQGWQLSLILFFFWLSCTTVFATPSINEESATQSDANNVVVSEGNPPRHVTEGNTAALVDLLKRKNILSDEEAARFVEQYGKQAGDTDAGVAALVELLKLKNILSEDEAAGLAKQHTPTPELQEKEQVERITANVILEIKKTLPDQVKAQVSEEVPKEVKKIDLAAAVPEWTKRIRFGGDVRLRYQNDRYDDDNPEQGKPTSPGDAMNTKINSDRFRYRVRLEAVAQVNEQIEATVRLGTGSDSNPISTNETFGDYMSRDSVYVDLAYLKWRPWSFLTLYGGRIPNPWFYSDLVWSSSLNFEGLAMQVNKSLTPSLSTFFTLGAFPLQQNELSQHAKWLTGGQLGLEMKQPKGISWKLGAAYYYFDNITGIQNDPLQNGKTNWTAPLYQQKGNTLFNINPLAVDEKDKIFALASDFHEFNVTATLDIGLWDPIHVVFLGDYVKNLGFDRDDVIKRTGNPDPEEDTTAYQIGMFVGYPTLQAFGQWKVSLYYKYLGADAVVDAFTDSDFHLGGTDAKGWIFAVDWGLLKNTWLTARWLSSDEISGLPFAVDTLQVDFNTRF